MKETQHKQHKDTLTQAKDHTSLKQKKNEATVQYTNKGDPARAAPRHTHSSKKGN